MPLSALSFIFYKLPFFRRDYADTYTYPHTLRFSDTLCLKTALNTSFLKLLFFPLYSFSLTPKHFLIIFSGKLATKNSQKTTLKEEKCFLLFFILFFTFSLSPYENKQNHLLFFPLFITGNRKTASENVLLK